MSTGDLRRDCAIEAGSQAAEAIAQLLNLGALPQLPRLRALSLRELLDEFEGEPGVAVFADLEGASGGQAGLLLTPHTCSLLLTELIGSDQKPPLDAAARSALCEVGNIAVSAAAGALSPLADGLVLPSVPRLATELRSAIGAAPAPDHGVYSVDAVLPVSGGDLPLRFVWIPDDDSSAEGR